PTVATRYPSAASCSYAATTVARAHPSSAASARDDGSRVPGARRPPTMAWRSVASIADDRARPEPMATSTSDKWPAFVASKWSRSPDHFFVRYPHGKPCGVLGSAGWRGHALRTTYLDRVC